MSPDTDLKLNVRQFVREAHNTLRHTSCDGVKLTETLAQMRHFLPAMHKDSDTQSLPYTKDELPKVQAEFMTSHYRKWLELLIDCFSIDWTNQIPRGQTSVLLDIFFLQGDATDSFSVLTNAVTRYSPGYKVNKCVSLLETFIRDHKLAEVMWDQCQIHGTYTDCKDPVSLPGPDPYTVQLWEELVILMVTLPDRVTNKLQRETSPAFYPDQYIPMVLQDLLNTLNHVNDSLRSTTDCSIAFLSLFLGKLCLSGYGERVWSLLMPQIVRLMESDFVWSRIWEKLIGGVPDRSLEAVITPLVKLVPWYGTLTRLLGSQILSSHKLQYLLTNKFLFLRYFPEKIVLQNIIGYLASSPSRKHLYHKVLKTLLEVWGDASAVKHTSYDQHLYLSQAILVCLAFLQDKDAKELRQGIMERLMSGVQAHLDSPIPEIRRLGMVVAEAVTRKADPSRQHKLEFQYDRNDEVDSLTSLLVLPVNPGIPSDSTTNVDNLQKSMEHVQVAEGDAAMGEKEFQVPVPAEGESDLDSDDEFEPYDLSNDTKVVKVKPPVYVRDCMEGLLSSDDGDRVEVCLVVAESLIRLHPSAVTEVASEFTKLLLHLQDSFSIPSFRQLRHSSMVSLAVIAPSQVSDYLTKEFYEPNYNLRQRMDVLEVLAAAAQELSRPSTDSTPKAVKKIETLPLEGAGSEEKAESEDWRQIVQRRIDSKTRRITRGRSQPEGELVTNRFASVAGQFFFPLLKNFDRPEATLNLLGEDHMVLGRLLYTLGVIVHSATNTNIVRQMGRALLEFIWVVRYHPQAGVRRAALFSVSMTILSVPGFVLLTDLQTETLETKTWLEDLVEKDVDAECRKLGIQALVLIGNVVKKEFHDGNSTRVEHQ